ncbi:MAG: hypothetical protein LBM01_03915 [Christensenellaceae bacterium]|jgi:hypothetical protein|nr:hypothetical protein [Christensenellaceae bacterium]
MKLTKTADNFNKGQASNFVQDYVAQNSGAIDPELLKIMEDFDRVWEAIKRGDLSFGDEDEYGRSFLDMGAHDGGNYHGDPGDDYSYKDQKGFEIEFDDAIITLSYQNGPLQFIEKKPAIEGPYPKKPKYHTGPFFEIQYLPPNGGWPQQNFSFPLYAIKSLSEYEKATLHRREGSFKARGNEEIMKFLRILSKDLANIYNEKNKQNLASFKSHIREAQKLAGKIMSDKFFATLSPRNKELVSKVYQSLNTKPQTHEEESLTKE